MSEKGMRIPFVARWPGQIEAGVAKDDLIDLSDVYPTLVELAGAALPEGVTLDGRSFASLLRGEGPGDREWIYSQLRDARCVRKGAWKLYSDGRLFNVGADPRERTDLADDPAAVRRKLALQDLLASVGV